MARSKKAVEKQQTTEVDEEAIARRAYEISQGDDAGTSEENWQRAERELREQAAQAET